MTLVRYARKFLRRLTHRVLQRLRQKARMGAIGVVHQLSLAADEQCTAFLDQFFLAEFFRLSGHKAAVIPGELDGRHGSTSSEFVEGERGGRKGSSVKRS